MALTDSTTAILTTYTYDPFGRTLASGAPSANPFQYTGREQDGTGLYAYRDRYYHPGLARFISEDRLRLTGGINFYAYALNNPVTFLDPFGLQTWPGRGPVTSRFGPRGGRPHRGTDIANPQGGDVRASDTGTVQSTTPTRGGGNTVVINHDDGGQSIYMHTGPTVRPGDRVYEGQPIGNTDLSGNSRGPHVHYEYRPPGSPGSRPGSTDPVDPLTHLPQRNNYNNPPHPPPGVPGGRPSCMGCGRDK